MGLFSDTLEECRNRLFAGDIDPCLIIDRSRQGLRTVAEIQNSLGQDPSGPSFEELSARLAELETIITGYLLGEKIVFALDNQKILRSSLVTNTLHLLASSLERSYHAVCEAKDFLIRSQKEGSFPNIRVHSLPLSEDKTKERVLKLLISNVFYNLQNPQTAAMDTSIFRKVVLDLSELIQRLDDSEDHRPAKAIVHDYLKREYHLKQSRQTCSNCRTALLENLPYCLNCYERNNIHGS